MKLIGSVLLDLHTGITQLSHLHFDIEVLVLTIFLLGTMQMTFRFARFISLMKDSGLGFQTGVLLFTILLIFTIFYLSTELIRSLL